MTLGTMLWDRYREDRIIRTVLPYTLVSPDRIRNLCRLALRIERDGVTGDVMECGVCNGGTAAVLAHFATNSKSNRTIWLLDSFQGMPEVTFEDGIGVGNDPAVAHVGKEVGDQASVKKVLGEMKVNMQRVRIVPGWFRDSFPSVTVKKIALLNIDADWYESVKLCLETFYDRVTEGGFISFDDYGHWPGCRQAVDEFFRARALPYKLQQVDYTAHWFQKT